MRFPRVVFFACTVILVTGCGLPRNAVPEELASQAAIPDIPEARFWGDTTTPELTNWIVSSLNRERAALSAQGISQLPDASFLALSGGGEDGAYGAGVLCGWTEHGDRPKFLIITGVSTGALIAPFAFLGPDYDHVLREVFTTLHTENVAFSRGINGILSDSMYDNQPLRQLIAKYVDAKFVARVAEEYHKGRSLIICTTNMDAQRPVVWAMGAIAASGRRDAVQLFRDVMIASSAIPGVFPPVYFKVQANGKTYEEMHSDGGTASQVFLYPATFSFKRYVEEYHAERARHVYVIRNARLAAEYKPIDRSTLPIAARAVSTLIKTQGVGDLYRIFLGCMRDKLDYNLAYIPDDFRRVSTEDFDPEYMKELFEIGYVRGKNGYPWQKAPPGFEPPVQEEQNPPTTAPVEQPTSAP
jgi:predicted acylesterase/phospholipase RssA